MWRKRTTCTGLLGVSVATAGLLVMGGNPPVRFGDPLPGIDSGLLTRFHVGKEAFEDVEDAGDGLGPVFNDVSCASCHSQGATGGGSVILETRFGRLSGGVFDPLTHLGGSLIQTTGIGLVGTINYVGEVVPPDANVVARRRSTPLFGLGLVDAVPDSLLQQIADFQQSHTPATAGRLHIVEDIASGGDLRVGKFGWKCQVATLATFSGDAYVNEMGITTPMFPIENAPQGDESLLDNPDLPVTPDDSDNSSLEMFTDFMSLLAPPQQRAFTEDAKKGAVLFAQIGCANCHLPALRTGPSAVGALSNVTFYPFSDFLLHDMGSLGDGIVQGDASGREMRTAPLWGVRVMTSFLHDGRASSLSAAILAHEGQGRAAKRAFSGLSITKKNQIITFLKSL